MTQVTDAIAEGLAERKSEKQGEKEGKEEAKTEAPKAEAKKEVKAAPVVEKPAPVEEAVAVAEEVKEEAPKKASKSSKADDLTKIEGVGPKAAEYLATAGLDTFAKVAKAKADKMKEILTEASSRMGHIDPTSWPKQAKMAADGKWDELKEWQDSVKGGVE